MKKRFVNESEAYNELMFNVSNSSVLSETIKNKLETLIMAAVSSARKDAANKVTHSDMLKCEKAMKHYNELKTLFGWDQLLSQQYKTYVLETVAILMKDKHIEETQRLYGNR